MRCLDGNDEDFGRRQKLLKFLAEEYEVKVAEAEKKAQEKAEADAVALLISKLNSEEEQALVSTESRNSVRDAPEDARSLLVTPQSSHSGRRSTIGQETSNQSRLSISTPPKEGTAL